MYIDIIYIRWTYSLLNCIRLKAHRCIFAGTPCTLCEMVTFEIVQSVCMYYNEDTIPVANIIDEMHGIFSDLKSGEYYSFTHIQFLNLRISLYPNIQDLSTSQSIFFYSRYTSHPLLVANSPNFRGSKITCFQRSDEKFLLNLVLLSILYPSS